MTVVVRIDPSQWERGSSQWDKVGPFYEGSPDTWRGAKHTHAWGANIGAFIYECSLPTGPWLSARLSARLSSEYPWFSAPPNHFSDITLVVNGTAYPATRVIPDDGSGHIYDWSLNPRDLVGGRNEIAFVVKKSATYRNGLCIYHRAVVPNERDYPILLEAEGQSLPRESEWHNPP